MLYYKAVVDGARDLLTFHETVVDELLTQKERKRYFPTLSDKCFEEVDIPKTRTCLFFGVRYECK